MAADQSIQSVRQKLLRDDESLQAANSEGKKAPVH